MERMGGWGGDFWSGVDLIYFCILGSPCADMRERGKGKSSTIW